MDDLSPRLVARAIEEGVDLAGIAAAGPARGAGALERWLDAGMHGEMDYMSRTRRVRADLSRLLPGCRSVVATAISYRTSFPDSSSWEARDGRAWVSRYAWGRDYHRVLRKRLLRVGRWLGEQRPGCSWRVCVDTAPVLEREWAARAGLGWIGKNTMLMNRRLGSELFLGLLLTDVALEPSRTATEHCGKCTACLDACPTAAIVEPRVLDARRCIAYLTIEHRTEVPPELRPALRNMVAGCDICQEVCPWTRKAPADRHPEFAPEARRYRPPLAELARLGEEAYLDWRRGSALNRVPFARFRRNLAAALDNLSKKR